MKYTVIWRDQGDEYMFTVVDTNTDPCDMTAIGWVLWAAEIEYADWDEEERIAAQADLIGYGYELIDVVKGELESVL